MRPFASFDHPLTTVATPDELIDGRVPLRMIDELRAKSIEAPILQALIDERGDTILKEERLLTTIIPHAMRGGKLTRMAKDFGVSSDTLRRRIRALGWQPAHLVSFIRVRAYEIRVAAGVSPGAALLAGGWTDPEAKRKVARRLARNRIHPS
jgi:AraC-like DNA-binding protein